MLKLSDVRKNGLWPTLMQFIKFGIVGASNTLISLAVYYLFLWLSRDLYVVGQIVGFFVSVLNAYYWNNRYVFSGGRFWDWKKLLKTYVAYGGSTLLSLGLSVLEVEVFHVSEWIVPVINLCITIPLNFITHKFWVYRKKGTGTQGKSAVVTGATSFLGSAVVRALLGDGYRVYALVRPGSKNRFRLPERADGLTVVEADQADVASVSDQIPGCGVWFHFAWGATLPAERNDPAAQQANVQSACAALDAAQTLGCRRFVFAGSQAEYGVHAEHIDETAVCAPVSEYGKAKMRFGELAAAQAETRGMEFCHLRVFSVYGAGDHDFTLVSSCVRTFLAGGDMPLSACTQKWNFLNIDDFARLAVAVAAAPSANGVFNAASGDTRPLREFVEEIHALCGGKGRCLYGGQAAKPEGAVQLDPDIHKTEAAFGWSPAVSFADGVRAMIDRAAREETL